MIKLFLKRSLVVKLLVTKVLLATFIIGMSPASARLVDLVNKGKITTEDGKVFHQIEAICSQSTPKPRYILNVPNEQDWCSQDIPDVCSRTQVRVATKVCKSSFSSKITKYNESLEEAQKETEVLAAPVATPAPSVDPRISIEEEKVRIEQEKLELRRKELELNKRRLELERESAAN